MLFRRAFCCKQPQLLPGADGSAAGVIDVHLPPLLDLCQLWFCEQLPRKLPLHACADISVPAQMACNLPLVNHAYVYPESSANCHTVLAHGGGPTPSMRYLIHH